MYKAVPLAGGTVFCFLALYFLNINTLIISTLEDSSRIPELNIPPSTAFLDWFIHQALEEDVRQGDQTVLAIFPEDTPGAGLGLMKADGVVAGLKAAQHVFTKLDSRAKFRSLVEDGDEVPRGTQIFQVEAPLPVLLTGERLALNILQRMSAIASLTRRAVHELAGTECKLLDTRKTTPLFRAFEKWAVHIGGGTNHRMGLYDLIMIKDNHVDYAGSLEKALQLADEYRKTHAPALKIEIETRNLDEVECALATGIPEIIMLDNMTTEHMRQAVELNNRRATLEASGGITLETLAQVAATGVDAVSMGALTHSAGSLDISMKAQVKH